MLIPKITTSPASSSMFVNRHQHARNRRKKHKEGYKPIEPTNGYSKQKNSNQLNGKICEGHYLRHPKQIVYSYMMQNTIKMQYAKVSEKKETYMPFVKNR